VIRLGLTLLVVLLAATPAAHADWTYAGCVAAASVAEAGACTPGGPVAGASGIAVAADGLTVAVAGSLSGGLALFGRDPASGALTLRACATDNGTDGRDGTDGACLDGDALSGPTFVASDGPRLLAAGTRSGSLTAFTGDLAAQALCLKASAQGRCGIAEPALAGARGLALAPGHVYVAGAGADAVAVLRRDAAGLTPAGCVSADGSDGHCADGAGLLAPSALALSPDGRALDVVAAGSQGVASFARDPGSGALRQTGCLLASVPRGGSCRAIGSLGGAYALAVAGADVYVAGRYSAAITRLRRAPGGGLRFAACRGARRNCAPDGALYGVRALAVTPAGDRLVAATPDALQLYARDTATGELTREACVRAQPRSRTRCTVVPQITGARTVTVTPDGRDVLVGTDTGVAVFRLGATR
jgi:DNA-binding beta-propeller fold protein YncE